MALLVDLTQCCSTGASLQQETDLHIFLLYGKTHRRENGFSEPYLTSHRSLHVLDSGSTAECLYRLKQTMDHLDLSSIRVLTTARGREVLVRYQEMLFTAVYTFDYKVTPADKLTCSGCRGSAHTDSPEVEVQDVSDFLQQLPALKGNIRILKSTLIPGGFHQGCFRWPLILRGRVEVHQSHLFIALI
ncbi:hypothetical protein AMECASPLE_011522 [Ameca splendens]|uniref:Uncharacterized protein n=1 Tax=Ameca splendens TaxID=208324 RepID=A0ABV0XPT0_9TELE